MKVLFIGCNSLNSEFGLAYSGHALVDGEGLLGSVAGVVLDDRGLELIRGALSHAYGRMIRGQR